LLGLSRGFHLKFVWLSFVVVLVEISDVTSIMTSFVGAFGFAIL